MKEYNIASIAGDGIGKEVLPEGLKVLKDAALKHQFKINFTEYDFASCDYYEKHGKMLPDDWKEKLGKHDAIFFGAVGMPDRVPDHISLWGSLNASFVTILIGPPPASTSFKNAWLRKHVGTGSWLT